VQVLGIKSFFLDWIIASVLIFLSLYFLFGHITVMDTQATVSLHKSCSSVLPAEELIQKLQGTLHADEHCEIVSPCVDWRAVRCEGTLPASGLYDAFLFGGSLSNRMFNALSEHYEVAGWKDTPTLKFEPTWILFLMGYLFILVETVAVLFALWRQKALKQAFILPEGLKTDQLIKPAIFAVILAISIVSLNFMVFNQFDYQGVKDEQMMSTLFNSVYGIAFTVIVAPLAEELTFRGVFLKFFIDRNRLLLGTIVVSLLFSVFHGLVEKSLGWQLYISSLYFVGSVILCRVFIKQKNLWSPIIFHSAYNSTMVVFYQILV
jgi:membrane protease YdiL (CAAX protease family)